MIYVQVLDDVAQNKKRNLTGQISLFDFAGEEDKTNYEINLPEVGEYTIEQKLNLEKEVMGVYVSGHPLEAYADLLKKNITNTTLDFSIDEENNEVKVNDGSYATVGGIITGKTLKTTKTNSMMAFITLEDMVGAVEIIIFPRDYDKYKLHLNEDNKVLVRGKISVEEDKPAKLICQEIIPFDSIPKEIWIKYPNKDRFVEDEQRLYGILSEYDGRDSVCIYLEGEKAIKHLPKSMGIKAEVELIDKLKQIYTEANIKVIENSIEKARKID
jgi:DNA polymerase III subunit alpha